MERFRHKLGKHLIRAQSIIDRSGDKDQGVVSTKYEVGVAYLTHLPKTSLMKCCVGWSEEHCIHHSLYSGGKDIKRWVWLVIVDGYTKSSIPKCT